MTAFINILCAIGLVVAGAMITWIIYYKQMAANLDRTARYCEETKQILLEAEKLHDELEKEIRDGRESVQ